MIYKIHLKNADDINEYLNGVNRFKGDIDLILNSKTYDGKSIYIVNMLANLKPVNVVFRGNEEEGTEFYNFIKKFIVE